MMRTRTEYAKKNVIFTFISYIVKLISVFVARTILIKYLGSMYLGINGLFSGILTMLSLTELGIGSALVFSMYKPIADNDSEKVKQLLDLYRKIYSLIGVVVLVIGFAIMPFLRFLIADASEIPQNINIYLVYGIFLLNSGISYFVAYKRSLLFVCQRSDVESIVDGTIQILLSITQIVLIIIFRNYYTYILVALIFTVLQNAIIQFTANKLYPQYKGKPQEVLPKSERRAITNNIGALILHKIGAVVAGVGVDSIVISAVIGIIELGYYSNYLLIVTYLTNIIVLVVSAVKSSMGNAIAQKTVKDNKILFDNLVFILFWGIGICVVCLINLFNPFISLWLGEEFCLSFIFVVFLSLQFYITNCRLVVNSYKECLGYFKQDMFKPLIEAIVNIATSILFAKLFGVIGVVIGTILSMLLVCCWLEPLILYKNYFNMSVMNYWKKVALYLIVTIIGVVATCAVNSFIKGPQIVQFIIKALNCLLIPNLIFVLCLWPTKEFKNVLRIAKGLLKRKQNSQDKLKANEIDNE